ncbi:thiamine pyrophosphate-binding protein [Porticoccaceae bacterium]|nr:thiamine pyrophosphate-binding protein [Porticoccaceae bacterium]
MYTNEEHILILLSLLKAHNVRHIVVSPGSTNIPISGSVQNDSYFIVHSCVDERSAAYIAIGLSEKLGEPVALSCTGATASRNYLPGLTEAFYRKIPIVAITGYNGSRVNGHLVPQNIDRSILPKDVAQVSVELPCIKNDDDRWFCSVQINKALIELRKNGCGPVHINFASQYTGQFDVKSLPSVRDVAYFQKIEDIPKTSLKKIAVFIGSHKIFSKEEVTAIGEFSLKHGIPILTDSTSNYFGYGAIKGSLVSGNFGLLNENWKAAKPELVIHLGEVSGDYYTSRVLQEAKEVWRLTNDGIMRDTGRKLRYLLDITTENFFSRMKFDEAEDLLSTWVKLDSHLRDLINNLPFSNVWMAQQLSQRLDKELHLYFAILNSLRSWNFFLFDCLSVSSNVGGFGIDGCLSTAIGGALGDPTNMHLLVIGDLAFFYDMNSLANRHLPPNLRIILINNGCGVEFNNKTHIASKLDFSADELISAGGHFNSSENGSSVISPPAVRLKNSIVSSYCKNLGFEYKSALKKNDFLECLEDFLIQSDRPKLIECFTDVESESNALEYMLNLDRSGKEKIYKTVKDYVPSKLLNKAKKVVKR